MPKYTATTALDGQPAAFNFSTHYKGFNSICRECKNCFPAEDLDSDDELHLLRLRRLQTELFARLPICPGCMKKAAARFEIELVRE